MWETEREENKELNEIRKMNRREGWGMGSEGSRLLAFPLPPTLFISLMNFTLNGSFGQERRMHREPWKKCNQIFPE